MKGAPDLSEIQGQWVSLHLPRVEVYRLELRRCDNKVPQKLHKNHFFS